MRRALSSYFPENCPALLDDDQLQPSEVGREEVGALWVDLAAALQEIHGGAGEQSRADQRGIGGLAAEHAPPSAERDVGTNRFGEFREVSPLAFELLQIRQGITNYVRHCPVQWRPCPAGFAVEQADPGVRCQGQAGGKEGAVTAALLDGPRVELLGEEVHAHKASHAVRFLGAGLS